MDLHVKRFHEKTAHCCDLVDEEVIANVYLYGMVDVYWVLLENIYFPSFSRLIEAAANKWVHEENFKGKFYEPP